MIATHELYCMCARLCLIIGGRSCQVYICMGNDSQSVWDTPLSVMLLAHAFPAFQNFPPHTCDGLELWSGYLTSTHQNLALNLPLSISLSRMLREVSHVVLDEVHERSIQSDFLTIILKDILPHRLVHKDMHACIYISCFALYTWIRTQSAELPW